MIPNVDLYEEQVIVKENPLYKLDFRFENTKVDNIVPEGYITSEEFRKLAIAKVNSFCDKHGLL